MSTTPFMLLQMGGVVIKKAEVIPPTPEGYVDLGLPSGTLWAKCNVGATEETGYGKYFQWGDTVGYTGDAAKAHSRWNTAPFNNGSSSYDSNYFASVRDTVCPNGVLAVEYDAAYAATDGKQVMPTTDQFNELYDNTTSEWTQVNGVSGRKFTSKTDTTKYIFVPASGYVSSGYFDYEGSRGYYWSSSLYSDNPNSAHFLAFLSGGVDPQYGSGRYFGFSVRGVLATKS